MTMIYKEKKDIRILFPFDKTFKQGDTVEVTSDALVDQLLVLGFEIVEDKKKKKKDEEVE